MDFAQKDKNLIWHPFTQEKNSELPLLIEKASGSYVFDSNGKKYLDAISSWWVNLHGHSHPKIAKAIYEQALNLEHIIFAGFTHKPAVTLCEKLSEILPNNLKKFFFSDNGSTSVEIALKMTYQYWFNKNQNKEKKLFLTLKNDYHGDTFGAMSASLSSNFHKNFEDLFFEFHFIDTSYDYLESQNYGELIEKEEKILQDLEDFLEINYWRIASFICEPLIQGANGMTTYRPEFLNKLANLLKKYEILIIFDEVMTGFGRTGKNFAFEYCNFVPDIICLSKGLTGGFLPMALTITTNNIYDAFLSDHYSTSLAHGHSYTANPLGCAAAIASLELLLEEQTQNQIQMIQKTHKNEILNLKNSTHGLLKDFRNFGTISAFTITDKISISNSELKKIFLDKGLILRPIQKNLYILPPYCITELELKDCYEKIKNVILNCTINNDLSNDINDRIM
jgi:adenosylmethionine-8-amino-7-oxononanoate aminotransferase